MHALGNLSKKQLLLFGFLLILAILIPVTLFLVKHQQNTSSNAATTTSVSFNQKANSQLNLNANPGDTIDLPIFIDPGQSNLVSVVTLQITYDASVLHIKNTTQCIIPTGSLPTVTSSATCTANGKNGQALIRLAASGVQDFITDNSSVGTRNHGKTKIADIIFTADPNATGTTEVDFSKALTMAGSSQVSDPESNVIDSYSPAVITFGGAGPSPSVTGTETPTDTPTPTTSGGGGVTPTTATLPVCSNLTTDVSTTGTAPYTITFTATGQPQGD